MGTGILLFSLTDDSADGFPTLIRATKQLSAGVKYVKNEYRVIGVADGVADAVTLAGAYVPKFGVTTLNSNIYASVQFVNGSGQKTVESTVKVTMIA